MLREMETPRTAWAPPPRADWVDALNQLGESLDGRARSLVPLDADTLLADARAATGLDDFGDPRFREGLDLLLGDAESEAQLTLLGRLLLRAELARTLESRLRVEAVFAAHPGISEERIEAPVFVTGLARTGTSLLHELLGQIPEHRFPITWQMMDPAGAVPGADAAAAQARCAGEIDMQTRSVPALDTMHEHRADLPSECIYLFGHDLASDIFTGAYQVPNYTMWMARRDKRGDYATHRRLLQLLQWGRERQRWVLKAPSHMSQLPALFETYPDARVIVTHRDPLKALGSLANLMASLRWSRSDHVDYAAIVGAMSFGHVFLAERVMELRDSGSLPGDRILDVRYCDLVGDPLKTVGEIGDWLGSPLGAEGTARLEQWMARRPKDRHGSHEYDFSTTGLDLAEQRARHAGYQERYDVPSEV